MGKKRPSAKSSRTSNKASPELSPLASDIIKGLQEGIAHMRGEITLHSRVVFVPGDVDVRAIREKSGFSQAEFAGRYGFSLRTLQEWEQGRAKPDTAVRAYLCVIERKPEAVAEALGMPRQMDATGAR